MFKLTTVNLSVDWQQAHPYIGQVERGPCNDEELLNTLEHFREFDSRALTEANPYIIVTGPRGRHTVRNLKGQLILYNADDSSLAGTDLTAAEIVDRLKPLEPAPSSTPPESVAKMRKRQAAKPSTRTNRVIAIGMLVVGLALNGYTLYTSFYVDDVNRTPPLALITDQRELQDSRIRLAGKFVTGEQAGDRGIVLHENGSVQLYQLGPRGVVVSPNSYAFILGYRDRELYIAVQGIGQIRAINREKLVFFGDTYNRIK